MKTNRIGEARFTLLGLGALCAFMILPTACGDDDDPGGTAGAGGKDGGSDARGGSGGTGGAKDSGPDRVDAPSDRVDAGGAGGTGGTGGMAGTGGKAGASGAAGKAGAAGTGGTGGTPEAGPDTPIDGPPDISVPPDTGPDGDGGLTCPNPTNATRGRACLVLTPEQITFADAGPLLDGQGTLFIHVFGTPNPGDTTPPLAQIMYPPPNPDAGADSGLPPQTGIYSLPPVIEIDNLPTDIDAGTVYIRTLFVDNPLWLQTQKGLTYGMFVGGYNLNNGVQPPPPLRPVQLTTGMGTVVPQRLTALRRFTSAVVLGLPDGGAPAGDGQGPMSLGAFIQASPANQPVFGGLQVPCVDVTKGPIPVAGFFYSATAGDLNFWIGGQVDDFGVGGSSPAGALVSLTSLGEIPTPQRITITADQYSASIPQITLTGFRPPPDGGVDNVSCPAGDAGSDAGPDVGSDVGDDGASTDGSADDGG